MNLNIGGKPNSINSINNTGISAASNANIAKNSSVPMSNEEEKIKFCKQFNITLEQLNALLQQYPDLYSQSIDNVNNIIKKEAENGFSNEVKEVAKEPISVRSKVNPDIEDFNHKVFSEMSVEDKFLTYASELAKNKYLYGDKNGQHSLDDWNNLSEQEKQTLIENEIKSLKKDNSYSGSEKRLNMFFDSKMTKLQAANFQKNSMEDFEKRADVEEQVHEYTGLVLEENRSEIQVKALKAGEILSKVLIDAAKEKNLTKYKDHFNDNTVVNLTPKEKAEMLEDLGTTKAQILEEALKKKIDKGIASDDEKNYHELLTQLVKVEQNKSDKNYGRLDAFKNSKYGKDIEGCTAVDDKLFVYTEYLENETKNLSDKDKVKMFDEMLADLVNSGDTEIALALKSGQIMKSDEKFQKMIAAHKGSKTDAALNAVAVKAFGDNTEALDNLENTQRSWAKEDPKFGTTLACMTMDNATETQNVHLAASYADKEKWNNSVQMKVVDTAYACKDAKSQEQMLMPVAQKSDIAVKCAAAKRLDEAQKENQVSLTEEFIKDKEVNNAMIEDKTFSRFADENQVKAFKLHKARCEQNDYSKQDAIKALNSLSDGISQCKNPENQLAMHENIMTSKYSEVQEYAAGNIKNYDSSVQARALDLVFETGNKKAVEIAVVNLVSYKSTDLKAQELGRIFGESSASNAKDLQERFLGGKLTLKEISQLPASKRREYYIEMYKKASPSQKLEWLKKMPNGNQKKTIYTFIALYDNNLLTAMVESGKGLDMFSACNDMNAQNKIFRVMKQSENSEVKEQCQKIENDPRNAGLFVGKVKSDDNREPKTARTLGYSYMPADFGKGLELFTRQDKYGKFLLG